jgi:hypothetical protein
MRSWNEYKAWKDAHPEVPEIPSREEEAQAYRKRLDEAYNKQQAEAEAVRQRQAVIAQGASYAELGDHQQVIDNVEMIRKEVGLPSTLREDSGYHAYQVTGRRGGPKFAYGMGEYRLAQAKGMLAEARAIAKEQKLTNEQADTKFKPVLQEIMAAEKQTENEEVREYQERCQRETQRGVAQRKAPLQQEDELDRTSAYWKDGWFIR